MKKHIITLLLVLAGMTAQAQKDCEIVKQSEGSITFVVDKNLPAPKKKFTMHDGQAVAKWIIDKEQIPQELQKVVKTSFEKDSLKYMGEDNFYKCLVQAYADHRPLVLSPDMVWLIISQGFANYVNAHPEELRDKLVEHQGKMDIVVHSETSVLAPDGDWEKLLKDFSAEIAKNTKGDIAETMTANFTTTGTTERIASRITLMETVKSYFTYWDFAVACGIPYITLKGTPEDWENVLSKTQRLSQYGLRTWTQELETILTEFVKAAQGKPDQRFWQSIIKKKRKKGDYYAGVGCSPDRPTQLDGWFLKFFPDKQSGKTHRNYSWNSSMPSEMVRVGFYHVLTDPTTDEALQTLPMELWAGFVGVEEDAETHAFIPKIGWLARIADEEAENLARLEKKDKHIGLFFLLWQKGDTIPEILSKMKHIHSLSLSYSGIPVDIPAWLDNIEIEKLTIEGKLTDTEENQLRQRFPNAVIKNQMKDSQSYQ